MPKKELKILPNSIHGCAKVVSLNKLGNFFCFTLKIDYASNLKKFIPGQFIQIKPQKNEIPLFMRPFSIYKVKEVKIKNKKKLHLSILIKIVGEATYNLTCLKTGDKVLTIAPLGKGFNFEKIKSALLVGGGIGVAPLIPLAKKLKEQNIVVYFFYGAKNKAEIINLKEIKKYSNEIFITTEDGSLGQKGLIIDLLKNFFNLKVEFQLQNSTNFKIFSCGPKPLLKEIQKIALQKNIAAEISLEEKMICGYGVCLGCGVKNTQGEFIKTCTEGPVININKIIF